MLVQSLSLAVAVAAFLTFFLTRLTLLLYTGFRDVPWSLWPGVLAKGVLFDAATLAYLLPIFLLADAFLPARVRANRWVLHFRQFVFGAVLFFLFSLSAMEMTFWMEFHTRFNFIALDYLIYTTEVLRNIWQSYPVVWIFSTLAVMAGLLAWKLRRRHRTHSFTPSRPTRWAFVIAAVALPLLSARLVRVEMMYRQGNAYAEEIAGNGLFTLAAAERHNELDYARFYATIPQPEAYKILHRLGVAWAEDTAHRESEWGDDAGPQPLPPFLKRRPRNVVLVSIESLSASYVGAYGSNDGLTPNLDRMAKEGLLFKHCFATGTRTVRGLEALSLATPPIPGQAIIRRPHNAHLTSVGEMLRYQNFNVFFFYGGYGYFDNMNAFFGTNGYAVYDRPSIPKKLVSFENAWGVADEALFNHALDILDQEATSKKPIFAHLMTTSNHRPYTYPPGRIDIPSPGGRAGAVKYTDYAIGQFIENARTRPWFKDTLFVFVADHCASVAGKTTLPVADYRIPLVLYGPEIVKPGEISRMISQMDIPPTLFDILGVGGDDQFFGQELSGQRGPARAFISNYQDLGYYKNDQLIVLKPKRAIEAYRVDPATFESTPMAPDPILVNEAIAYYQTASRAFKLGKLELLWKPQPPHVAHNRDLSFSTHKPLPEHKL